VSQKGNRATNTVEGSYVPIEDDPTVDHNVRNGAGAAGEGETPKPSMKEVFGPGGFLERCMKGGFDRSVVSLD